VFTGGEETTCEGSWKLKLKADGGWDRGGEGGEQGLDDFAHKVVK
jgi:hypothetical protein